ncbi:hypothetical protein K6U06_01530 [Acidiferrimicrobium sp. IK]|uniref:alpha/beta hydrolase family protein n=1 Tax=Acidiferrimicrobium sp. IK TaxID=2871700 RepID=UPI0021CB0B10|nr:hypothetical protein [Acidiferrimicrobium sp. IK]MCU4183025.1 hypothetical protein [Acidiferrimicrobium sp. IK]
MTVGGRGGDRWERPGEHPTAEAEITSWTTVEGRSVAVFAQYPTGGGPLLPVVLLCHGLGGGHRGYAGLGAHLASHGYAVLHPQFLDAAALAVPGGTPGSDERSWKSDPALRAAMLALLFDPAHWLSRVERARAVLDTLTSQRHVPGLDPDGVVVAGHSFGAYTAQLLLGTRLYGVGMDGRCFRHPAVAGGVLLSPQGSGDRGLTDRSWDGVELPLLEITATRDLGPHGEGLAWRREVFDAAASRRKYLAVVRGGDHFLGGIPVADRYSHDEEGAEVRTAVAALATAFADEVRGDDLAGEWLAGSPFSHLVDHERSGVRSS